MTTDTQIKPWAENDDLFFKLLDAGYGWQLIPYVYFKQYGFDVQMPELAVRASIKTAGKFRDTLDLLVNGHRVEVKSRAVRFTGPKDWPDNRLPAFVDTKPKYDAHADQPLAYVFVSQATGAMVCTDGRLAASRRWSVEKRRDRVRNIQESFYAVEGKHLRTMDALVAVIRNFDEQEDNAK